MNYNKVRFRTYEPRKEAVIMSSELKRITFVVPQDMEMRLDEVKKERFYNRSTSEMVRTLIEEGWKASRESKEAVKQV